MSTPGSPSRRLPSRDRGSGKPESPFAGMGSRRRTAAVAGGGLGGLAAAVSLSAKGFSVTLFEKGAELGGKAGSTTIGGYRFDTGPSLLTLPEVFDELFARAGRRREDYIDVVPLRPLTRYWFADGTKFTSDLLERFIPEAAKTFRVQPELLERYFRYAGKIYDLTHPIFLEQSLHRFGTYLSRPTLHALPRFFSIDPLRTMHVANASACSDPRLVQLLDRYATYNGSSPYLAPATLNNIAYVEHGLGGFGVADGIYGIVRGMERLARELGVEIRTGTTVERILCDRRRRVAGVRVVSSPNVSEAGEAGLQSGAADGGEELEFPLVVSDVDALTLYTDLLADPDAPLARRYRRLPPSSSGLVFYWGISRSFPELGVHNIFFSGDYRREFAAIHERQQVPEDPTVYVNITSKISPADAPPGCENWFVLINAPPHDGRNWEDDAGRMRAAAIRRISEALGSDIEPLIAAEGVLTPRDIEEATGSYRGSLYGISSNTRMAAFLRHSNRSRRYRGLYLCGGSVHPGGGMPLAVRSGMIAADWISAREG